VAEFVGIHAEKALVQILLGEDVEFHGVLMAGYGSSSVQRERWNCNLQLGVGRTLVRHSHNSLPSLIIGLKSDLQTWTFDTFDYFYALK
jgi:hypothetical protein